MPVAGQDGLNRRVRSRCIQIQEVADVCPGQCRSLYRSNALLVGATEENRRDADVIRKHRIRSHNVAAYRWFQRAVRRWCLPREAGSVITGEHDQTDRDLSLV